MSYHNYMIVPINAREAVNEAGGPVLCSWCQIITTARSTPYTEPGGWIRVGRELTNGPEHVCEGCAYCLLNCALSLYIEGHVDYGWLCATAQSLNLSVREFRLRCVRRVRQWIAPRRDRDADLTRERLTVVEHELGRES